MKPATIFYSVLFLVILGGLWFGFGKNSPFAKEPVKEENPVVETDPAADWITYSNDNLAFSAKHPTAVKVYEDSTNSVGFRQLGPSQSEGTEMSDGISVSFRKITKKAKDTLEEIATSNLDQIKEVGTVKQEPVTATLAGKSGLTYSYSSLGDFKVYLLPVSDTQVLEVAVMVVDPSSQGFAKTVQLMLASLKLL